MEDLLNQLLNIVAPPLAFLIIWVALSSFRSIKRFFSVLGFLFKEGVSGKVILITGASSGIGEVAYKYAREGACLVLVARRQDRLRAVAWRCEILGSPDVIFLPIDVSSVNDCEAAVNAAVTHFGKLDHLVNNVGIVSGDLLQDCSHIDNLRPIMDINFWGSVYMTRFAIPHLRQSRGRITVVSSASSWLPLPRMSFYNASKAAMVAFFEVVRVEMWPEVKITIVTPGYIESEMTRGKYLSRECQMKLDPSITKDQVGWVPVGKAWSLGKAVVRGAAQGSRLVVEPQWVAQTRVWKILCPEILDWGLSCLYSR